MYRPFIDPAINGSPYPLRPTAEVGQATFRSPVEKINPSLGTLGPWHVETLAWADDMGGS